MSENTVVILGSLAIFAFVTIGVIALVYNRAILMKASDDAIELQTKEASTYQVSSGALIVEGDARGLREN